MSIKLRNQLIKIFTVVSFLLTVSTGLHTTINLGVIILFIYQLFSDIFKVKDADEIFWQGGLLALAALVAVIGLLVAKIGRHRYVILLCVMMLVFFQFALCFGNNFQLVTTDFILSTAVFLTACALLVYVNFKNPEASKITA